MIFFIQKLSPTDHEEDDHGSFIQAHDGLLNGFYGILLTIWSTCFIESWKRKEEIIRHFWANEKEAAMVDDERTDQFLYKNVYDDISFNKIKTRVEPEKFALYYKKTISGLCVAIAVGLMSAHIYTNGYFANVLKTAEEGSEEE